MGRIADTFTVLKKNNKKALITFITAGDPDLDVTRRMILLLEQAGADIVELGIPFSDPMADGPTIQKSSERALAAGTTLKGILALVKSVRQVSQIPIVLMGYYNPVFRYGPGLFVADAVDAGVDGVLLVDLPPEEAGNFNETASAEGLDVIFLLTPTSDEDRIGRVSKMGRGFVYYVSVAGVTGARTQIADNVFSDVANIKKRVTLPVAVGFGISNPEQAARIASVAEGVVVGSAIVKLFEDHHGEALASHLHDFVVSLKDGIAGTC